MQGDLNKTPKLPLPQRKRTSIMIKSTMQKKKEWEDFKKNVGQYKYYDIKIAELKIKMQDSKEIADSASLP
jgi:ribosomal protein S10